MYEESTAEERQNVRYWYGKPFYSTSKKIDVKAKHFKRLKLENDLDCGVEEGTYTCAGFSGNQLNALVKMGYPFDEDNCH